jgi:hypothetical protein
MQWPEQLWQAICDSHYAMGMIMATRKKMNTRITPILCAAACQERLTRRLYSLGC